MVIMRRKITNLQTEGGDGRFLRNAGKGTEEHTAQQNTRLRLALHVRGGGGLRNQFRSNSFAIAVRKFQAM
jgi:hypothetical protein